MRIAVIGSGISGLGFAYLAHQHHDVKVFEKSVALAAMRIHIPSQQILRR